RTGGGGAETGHAGGDEDGEHRVCRDCRHGGRSAGPPGDASGDGGSARAVGVMDHSLLTGTLGLTWRRCRQVFQTYDMNQRQAHHLIIDAWIAPGSRKTDYQIPMTDKNEVGVMNIVPQPFAGD